MFEIRFQSNQTQTLKKVRLAKKNPALKDHVKPQVLMVGTHLTKTRGGITTLITQILSSELRTNFDIFYIASQAEDYAGIRKALLALTALTKFTFEIFRRRPQLVYVHIGSNASLYRESLFIVLAKMLGRKVIGHFHAGDIVEYYSRQSKIGRKFISWAIGLSDKLIAVSAESAGKLKKLAPASQIKVIINAISTEEFDFSAERLAVREKYVRLLFVGAMGKLKGERDLADAIKILRGKLPQLRVSFLGYGGENLQNYCREIGIGEMIEFCGAVSLEERVQFFKKADIFVLPTLAEAMPISVLEAMSAGLPIIATSVGGIPEIIENMKEGILIKPNQPEQLAEKIELLAADKNLRVKMAKAARKKVRESLNFQVYIGKIAGQILQTMEKTDV